MKKTNQTLGKRIVAFAMAASMLFSSSGATALAEAVNEEPITQVEEIIEEPEAEPAPEPTPEPVQEPAPEPEPTQEPAPEPEPTQEPAPEPEPTQEPTPAPTEVPVTEFVAEPTPAPTEIPVVEPTPAPTELPTPTPAPVVEATPTPLPTATPVPTETPVVELATVALSLNFEIPAELQGEDGYTVDEDFYVVLTDADGAVVSQVAQLPVRGSTGDCELTLLEGYTEPQGDWQAVIVDLNDGQDYTPDYSSEVYTSYYMEGLLYGLYDQTTELKNGAFEVTLKMVDTISLMNDDAKAATITLEELAGYDPDNNTYKGELTFTLYKKNADGTTTQLTPNATSNELELTRGQELELALHYMALNSVWHSNVDENTVITYTFPAALEMSTELSNQPVKNNGETVGSYNITKDADTGSYKLDFTLNKDFLEKQNSNIQGDFSWNISLKYENWETTDKVPLEFGGDTGTITLELDGGTVTGEKKYDTDADGTVTFGIDLTLDQLTKNVTVQDVMGSNFTFVKDSFTLDGTPISASDITFDDTANSAQMTWTELAKGTHTITYKANVVSADTTEAAKKNTVNWDFKGGTPGSDYVIVDMGTQEYSIDKDGSYSNGEITWTIQVNNTLPRADMSGWVLTDVITHDAALPDQVYVADSFVITNSGGVAYTGGTLDTTVGKGGFTYTFGNDAGLDTYTITYKTKVADDSTLADGNYAYKNAVSMKKGDLTGPSADKTVDWKVDHGKVTLKVRGTKNVNGEQFTNANVKFAFVLAAADDATKALDAANTLPITKNSSEGYKIAFDSLTFTKAGTYNYTITESADNLPAGYSRDTTTHKLQVVVTLENGKLVAKATMDGNPVTSDNNYDDFSFNNTYNEAQLNIGGNKTVTVLGNGSYTLAANAFQFKLEEQQADGTWKTVETVGNQAPTATEGKTAGYQFATLTYTKADEGTHTYRVTEVVPATANQVQGMTYAANSYQFTVTVSVATDGTVTATPKITSGGADSVSALNFTNTYKKTTVNIPANKTLTLLGGGDGTLTQDQFTFTLTETDASWTSLGSDHEYEIGNYADGTLKWDTIADVLTYYAPGTHYYTLQEKQPANPVSGMVYDQSVYHITVTVADNMAATVSIQKVKNADGTAVSETAASAEFNNQQGIGPDGDTGLSGTKTLIGKSKFRGNAEFRFEVTEVDKNGSVKDGAATRYIYAGNTKGNTAAIDFSPAFSFTAAGTYYYKISETPNYSDNNDYIGDWIADFRGYVFDTTVYYATITVGTVGGALKITDVAVTKGAINGTPVEKNAIDFTNYYSTATAALKLNKTLGYDTYDDGEYKFTYTLTRVKWQETTEGNFDRLNAEESGGATNNTNYVTTAGGTPTVTLKKTEGQTSVSGTFSNYAFTFYKAGIYTYKLTEKKSGITGVTDDSTVYWVQFTVTRNSDANKTLSVETRYYDSDPTAAGFNGTPLGGADAATYVPTFNNYHSQIGLNLAGQKEYVDVSSGTETPKSLTAGAFTFALYQLAKADVALGAEGDALETVNCDANGAFSFATITKNTEGTTYYRVKEVAGTAADIEYDGSYYDIVYTVTQNSTTKALTANTTVTHYDKNGNRIDDETAPTALTLDFKNSYNSNNTPPTVSLDKSIADASQDGTVNWQSVIEVKDNSITDMVYTDSVNPVAKYWYNNIDYSPVTTVDTNTVKVQTYGSDGVTLTDMDASAYTVEAVGTNGFKITFNGTITVGKYLVAYTTHTTVGGATIGQLNDLGDIWNTCQIKNSAKLDYKFKGEAQTPKEDFATYKFGSLLEKLDGEVNGKTATWYIHFNRGDNETTGRLNLFQKEYTVVDTLPAGLTYKSDSAYIATRIVYQGNYNAALATSTKTEPTIGTDADGNTTLTWTITANGTTPYTIMYQTEVDGAAFGSGTTQDSSTTLTNKAVAYQGDTVVGRDEGKVTHIKRVLTKDMATEIEQATGNPVAVNYTVDINEYGIEYMAGKADPNLYLEDILPLNATLVMSTVKLYAVNGNIETELTGFTPTYSVNADGHTVMHLTVPDGQHLRLRYTMQPLFNTSGEEVTLVNEVTIVGLLTETVRHERTVRIYKGSATISGVPGTFAIQKFGKTAGGNVTLEGATFALYKVDVAASTAQNKLVASLVETATTDSNGRLTFGATTKLQLDELYYYTETDAPAGYQPDGQNQYFVLPGNEYAVSTGVRDQVNASALFQSLGVSCPSAANAGDGTVYVTTQSPIRQVFNDLKSTSVTFTATKHLDGKAPAADNAYHFTLTEVADAAGTELAGATVLYAANLAGSVTFDAITYTYTAAMAAGGTETHYYKLAETAGNDSGILYDSAVRVYKVEVSYDTAAQAMHAAVTDVTEGTGTAIIVGNNGTTESVYTFNNTSLTSLSGTKAWVHNENTNKPTGVTLALYRYTTDVDLAEEVTLDALGNAVQPVWDMTNADAWTWTYANLPAKAADGALYTYYAVERDPATGYSVTYQNTGAPTVTDKALDGGTITNTYYNSISISGTKKWVNKTPVYTESTVTLALYRYTGTDAAAAQPVAVEAPIQFAWINTDTDTWTWTYSELPQRDPNGNEYTYYVQETAKPAGFTESYTNPGAATVTDKALNGGVITNEYSTDKTSITLGGQKSFTGRAGNAWLESDQFTVSLTRVNQTPQANPAGGDDLPASNVLTAELTSAKQSYSFTIHYTKPGTYQYRVTEVLPAVISGVTANGITYDTTEYLVTVTVEDNGAGKLVATPVITYTDTAGATANADADALNFTNDYHYDSVEVEFSGEKTLEGRENDAWTDADEYTITLTPDADNLTNNNNIDPVTALEKTVNSTTHSFAFGPYTYTTTGTWKYTVQESIPALETDRVQGIVYDTARYEITVAVTDNGKGKLVANTTVAKVTGETQTTADPAELNFTNTYRTAELELEATKYYFGAAANQSFTLELYKANADGTQSTEPDALLDSQTLAFDTEGGKTAAFAKQTYTRAGTYYYLIQERQPLTQGTVVYDPSSYLVTVEVTADDAAKTLTVGTPTYIWLYEEYEEAAESADFYNNEVMLLSLEHNFVTVTAHKLLNSSTEGLEDGAYRVSLYDGDTVAASATNNADGLFELSVSIPLGEAKTYTLKEENGGSVVNGIYYDASEYAVTVDADGSVSYSSGTEPIFNNTSATSVTVTKVWAGDEAISAMVRPASVTVTLYADGEPVAENGTATLSEATGWAATFGELPDRSANGTLINYTVVEEVPTGYTASLEQVEAETGYAFTLTNTYNMASNATYTPQINKVLTGRDSIPMAAGEFAFTLTGEVNGETIEKTAYNTAGPSEVTGENANQATVAFDALSFTQAGTYTFTIQETEGEDAHIAYDAAAITLTVTVTAENGVLTATGSYTGGSGDEANTFTNTYYPIAVRLQKTSRDGGEGLVGATYALWIKNDNGNDAKVEEVVSTAGGYMLFKNIVPGVKYYFKEVAAPAGHTVDEYPSETFRVIQLTDGSYKLVYEGEDGFDTATANVRHGQPTANTVVDGSVILDATQGVSDEVTKLDFSKLDDTTGEFVVGAKMQIIDQSTGTVVLEWTTENGIKSFNKLLNVNTRYILREVSAPSNYEKASDTVFSFDDYGIITVHSGPGEAVSDTALNLEDARIQGVRYETDTETKEIVKETVREVPTGDFIQQVREQPIVRTVVNTLRSSPQTGDNAPILLVVLLMAAGVLFIIYLQERKKGKRSQR